MVACVLGEKAAELRSKSSRRYSDLFFSTYAVPLDRGILRIWDPNH